MLKKEKKVKKEVLIVLFMAGIMIFSVVGFIWTNSATQKLEYNGYSFLITNNGYLLNYQKKQVFFSYFPEQLTDLEINPEVKSTLLNKYEIDFTYDINDTLKQEIALMHYNMQPVLSDFLKIYLRQGLTSNNTFKVPIISCNTATPAVPVLYVKQLNETKITLNGNCVIAEIKDARDVVVVKERLLYSLLGVME